MRAILKDIIHLDSYESLDKIKVEDYKNFGFSIRHLIGEELNNSEESFDIFLCSPLWMLNNFKDEDIVIGRHFIIQMEYNYKKLYVFIKKQIESCIGQNWDEIALKIARIGYWEFEDYQEIVK